MTQGYNGWTSFPSWAINLWFSNDEGSYRYWRGAAQECWDEAEADGTFTREERARLDLADRMKDETEDNNPLADQASFWSDLLGYALAEVNWYEIAGHWFEDVDKGGEAPPEGEQ